MHIITLTSDFGTLDHSVALVKGQFLLHSNAIPVFIDITHNVANYNLPQASYFVGASVPQFPAKTFHCVFVNLFETTQRRLLCFEYEQQFILCADNGFANLLSRDKTKEIRAVALDSQLPLNLTNYVVTMAKCINWLDEGNGFETLGEICTDYIDKSNLRPIENENWLEGNIIYVDQYENVVTNITKETFHSIRKGRAFKIVFKRDEMIHTISESYGDVTQGEKLALFNSAGFLEIAINQGNAAGLFGLVSIAGVNKSSSTFLQKGLYYQTIKIYFE
jgi:S-adenosyl-L-methionine hydrolase (adenosine-forming)